MTGRRRGDDGPARGLGSTLLLTKGRQRVYLTFTKVDHESGR